METMIWLLLWTLAFAFGFILGYQCGIGRPSLELGLAFAFSRAEPKAASRHKEMDPVCREPVAMDHARPSVYEGKIYYFCSRDCREIFEAAPPLYIHGGPPRGATLLEEPLGRQSAKT